MALVVETTSTVSSSNANSLTITKPTGVVSGDLLVIVALGEHDANDGSSNGPACSGFTQGVVVNRNANNSLPRQNMSATFLYRIADASDVSAANYSITLQGTETLGIAAMLRVSGWASGNPVWSDPKDSSSSGASSLSIVRPNSSLLIMLQACKADTGGSVTYSGYSITSSGSNPSWTEVVDTNVTVNATTDSFTLSGAVAYANDTNTSNITAYTATPSSTSGDRVFMSFLAVLIEPTSPTTEVSHNAIIPTVFAPTVTQVNVAPSVGHLDSAPTINSLTAETNNPTVWTPTTKS